MGGGKVFWDPRAPSIGGTILRKGHLVHVRGTKFVGFADLNAHLIAKRGPDAMFELTEAAAR